MMSATQNMMPSVLKLETQSQRVRLLFGWELDGITNGKSDTPAVKIMPNSATELAMKAIPERFIRVNTMLSTPPIKPSAGIIINQGTARKLLSQAPVSVTTVLPRGLAASFGFTGE